MIVYHEAQVSSAEAILRDGLKRTSRGKKGDDELIMRTDQFLDSRRPASVLDKDISRDDNIYAYVAYGDGIIDITDGAIVPIEGFMAKSAERNQAVLSLTVDPARCYVSDLDAFDLLKQALSRHSPGPSEEQLAERYWQRIVCLEDFVLGQIARPELMVTYDVSPSDIERIQ